MQIFGISIIRKDQLSSLILCEAQELSSFNFLSRAGAGQFISFSSKTIAERTEMGVRQSIEEKENIVHAYTNMMGLSGVIVCDKEYPARVAFALITKILDDFLAAIPREDIAKASTSNRERVQTFKTELERYLQRYQDPFQADPIMRVQKELDETKIVLHKSIQSLLERGEKLDDLVAKSDELGSQSKLFFKHAQKTNSGCCVIM